MIIGRKPEAALRRLAAEHNEADQAQFPHRMTEKAWSQRNLLEVLSPSWKETGVLVHVLLPSVKMKAKSRGNLTHERRFHDFLISRFNGYTVTGGNITGYWIQSGKGEECNEHREYQIAVSNASDLEQLRIHLAKLAAQLKERTVFCTIQGHAFLIHAAKTR